MSRSQLHRRHALDEDAVGARAVADRPVRRDVVAQPRHVLDDDARLAAHDAHHLEAQPRHGARLDLAVGQLDRLLRATAISWRCRISSSSTLQRAAIMRTDGPQAIVSAPGISSGTCASRRLAEAHHLEERLGLVVGGVVEDLLGADRVDALGEAREHDRQRVGREAGVDARAEERGAAGAAGVLEAAPDRLGQRRRIDQRHERRRHQVLPRGEDAAHVVERGLQPEIGGAHVRDAVRRRAPGSARRRRWRPRRCAAARRARRRRARACPALLEQSPTSSSSGWFTMARSAWMPTWPVAHWITRNVTAPPGSRRA